MFEMDSCAIQAAAVHDKVCFDCAHLNNEQNQNRMQLIYIII